MFRCSFENHHARASTQTSPLQTTVGHERL
jgi:hypothetical protein